MNKPVILEIKSLVSRLVPLDMSAPGMEDLWGYLDMSLSYEIHNSAFMKAMSSNIYIRDIWDGHDHLFKTNSGKFLTGLLPLVEEALKQFKIPHTVVDYRPTHNPRTTSLSLSPTFVARDYQMDAVDLCIKKKRGIIWARPRSGKCVNFDSILFTQRGMISFKELVGFHKDEKEFPCEVPLFGRIKEVNTAGVYCKGYADTLTLTTRNGYTIEGTPEHPILVLDSNTLSTEFKRLENITKTDTIVIQRNQEYFGNLIKLPVFTPDKNHRHKQVKIPTYLTKELCRFFAYVIAEGCVSGTLPHSFTFSNTNKTMVDDYINISKKLFDVKVIHATKGSIDYVTHSGILKQFLRSHNIFGKSANKTIPQCIRQAPREYIVEFLKVFFECEGSVGKNIEITSASKELIRQLQIILLNFGIIGKRFSRYNEKTQKHYWRVIIGGDAAHIFGEKLGFLSFRKCNKLKKLHGGVKIGNNSDFIPGALPLLKSLQQLCVRKEGRWWKNHRICVDGWRKQLITLTQVRRLKYSTSATYIIVKSIFNNPEFCALVNTTEEYNKLKIVLDLDYYFDGVQTIKPSKNYVVDFYVPESNSFFSNGFVNHNTLMEIILVSKLNKFPVLSICQSIDVAKQTIAKFKEFLPSAPVGLIGDGECDIRPVTIATIQSLAAAYQITDKFPKASRENTPAHQKRESIKDLVEAAKVVWVDECFPKNTKILIDPDSYMSIEKIIENPQVTHVLSYDLKTRQVVQKRILRKIKIQKPRKLMHIKIDVDGQLRTLNCTRNHKIWTTNGYIQAEDLMVGDEVKYFGTFDNARKIFICPECGLTDYNGHRSSIHTLVHMDYSGECALCGKSYKNLECHKAYHRDPELAKRIASNIDYAEVFRKREQNGKWRKSLKIMGKLRRGKNNPVFRHPDTIEKIRKSRKAAFDRMSEKDKHAQIVRFRNAPKYRGKMTKPERIVANLGFPELAYVGDGKYCKSSYMYKIEDPKIPGRIKRKIPDFIIKNTNKVIEVADREYWHTEEEMNTLITNYAAVNIKCLVIYADEINKDIDKVQKRIFTFIHNHTAKVVKVRKFREATTVYNLEVEDTHNYFANGILVSNCHHAASNTHKYILQNKIYNAEYILGCSGTPFREDNTDLLISGLLGPIIYEINYSKLIDGGYLVRPTIHLIKLPQSVDLPDDAVYSTVYKQAISINDFRNGIITKVALSLLKKNKTCMILVNKVSHGKALAEMIPDAEFSYSKTKNRELTWKRLKERVLPCLITTLGDEGVDIPSLDSTIIAAGGESAIKVFQRLRCMTPYPGKESAIIVDFLDPYRYLKKHSKKREDLYKSEPSFIINYKEASL